jgi:pimeloyl-ACP methyl ester carboxylesterase
MRTLKLLLGLLAAVGSALTLRWLLRSDETIDWEDAPRPGEVADVGGVGVHYVDRGSGPAAVLIHGFGGHTFSYRHNIPALAKYHRVIALDLKGFGYSERPPDGDYSLTAQAQLVLGLMDELGIESASVVGHSMGGEVAMRVAAASPERVENLVLVASVSGDRFPTLPPTPIIKPIMPFLSRLTARFLLKRGFYDQTKLTDDVREGYRAPRRVRGFMNGVYQLLRDARHDPPIEYQKITQPTLILWARAERLPGSILTRLRKHLPRAEVKYVEEAGHLLLEEQPEAVNREILRFIHPAGRAAEPVTTGVDSAQTPP